MSFASYFDENRWSYLVDLREEQKPHFFFFFFSLFLIRFLLSSPLFSFPFFFCFLSYLPTYPTQLFLFAPFPFLFNFHFSLLFHLTLFPLFLLNSLSFSLFFLFFISFLLIHRICLISLISLFGPILRYFSNISLFS